MFSTQSDNCILICPYFYIISLFAAELEEPKIGISGKGLNYVAHRLSNGRNTGVEMNLNLDHIFKPISTQCRILTYYRYIAVENVVRKAEIDCNQQFLLFSQVFSTLCGTYFPF